MYSCFQGNPSAGGGSAIFGALLPSRAKVTFISNFVFPSQDFVQHEIPTTLAPFIGHCMSMMVPQFIGTF